MQHREFEAEATGQAVRLPRCDPHTAVITPSLPPGGSRRQSAPAGGGPQRKSRHDVGIFREAAAANQHQRANPRQGKADTMSTFSVKQAAVNNQQQNGTNLGFVAFCPKGKSG
jgi:hypothetical protein